MARRSGMKGKRGGFKPKGGAAATASNRKIGGGAQGATRGPRGGRLGAMKPKSVLAAAKKQYGGGSR